MSNKIKEFENERAANIKAMGEDLSLKQLGTEFDIKTDKYKYSYNFSWMGRPIIQFPQDMVAMQEIIWNVKPDLIIETGIAHGGSLVFYASILELIGKGEVLGIDIDIRKHNRAEIEKHPLNHRIKMIQGSSVDQSIVTMVKDIAKDKKSVMVLLDSNHTHGHVYKELQSYSGLVSLNSYLVIFDTCIEDVDDSMFQDRPWGKGNNPATAVKEFLSENTNFVPDSEIIDKLVITVAPGGYLKRIK